MRISLRTYLVLVALAAVAIAVTIEIARERRRLRDYTKCGFNLTMIHSALMAYHDRHGRYPPEFSTDPDGNPLLSWRVILLPELHHHSLYNQFHLDEPWDSDHNIRLVNQMPSEYLCLDNSRKKDGYTPYIAVRQSSSDWFESPKATREVSRYRYPIQELPGGGVIWTAPADAAYVRSASKRTHPHEDIPAIQISSEGSLGRAFLDAPILAH